MVDKRAADLDRFATGMVVTLRFRVASAEPHMIYDLTDSPTWPWLVAIRRRVTMGSIEEVTERGIVFVDAQDRGRLAFRVTEKTRIEIGGKPLTLSDLRASQAVAVAPRLLPNGETMASAIGDTVAVAERLRERSKPTVTGLLKQVDVAQRTIQMDTRAGDHRSLTLASSCIVRRDGRDVPIAQLRAGQWVTAHIGSDGDREQVRRITIGKKPATSARPKPRSQ
jgi:hypothetical protein